MKLLITAGSPSSPIDQVRRIGTIFTGRTGSHIAQLAWGRGHTVTFLTSNAARLPEIPAQPGLTDRRMQAIVYSSFDDLAALVQQKVKSGEVDVLIHAAGATDYLVAGTYTPELGTYFNVRNKEWEARERPKMIEQPVDRISSSEPELWVRLVRSPRLIERVREWGYRGLLVRFVIETARSDAELRGAAEFSRKHSGADLMVASTMESLPHWSLIGPVDGRYERVPRREVSERLIMIIEHMRQTDQGSWHDHD